MKAGTGLSKRARAVCSLLLVMLIWGSSVSVTKTAVAEFPPFLLALLRFIIASVILLPFAQMRGGPKLLPTGSWGRLFLTGLMGVTLHYMGVNLSLTYTTASQGALIQSLAPALTAILAYLWLRERVSHSRAIGIGLAAVGAGVVISAGAPNGSSPNPVLGSVLMILAVLAWCGYTIVVKRMADADSIVVTTYSVLIGTAMLVPAAALEAICRPMPTISFGAWLSVIYLGVAGSAGAYLLYNRALRFLDAGQVTNYMNLLPVVGVAMAVLFLGEALVLGQIVGGVLVLIGVWMSSSTDRVEDEPASLNSGVAVQSGKGKP